MRGTAQYLEGSLLQQFNGVANTCKQTLPHICALLHVQQGHLACQSCLATGIPWTAQHLQQSHTYAYEPFKNAPQSSTRTDSP